jgi:hypothetical protein
MMLFYKLKKLFKEKKADIITGALTMALIFSVFSLSILLFWNSDEFCKSEKRQMVAFSIVSTSINLFIIYLTDSFFNYNIILSIIVGYLISFLIFVIPGFFIILYFEYDDLILDKSEIREAKIDSLFRKLF